MNIWRTGKEDSNKSPKFFFFTFLVFAGIFSLGGCATSKTKSSAHGTPESSAGIEASKSEDPHPAPAPVLGPEPPPPSYGPDPVYVRPVALVLNSASARTFAHLGALKALSSSKIAMGAIYCEGLSCLPAALFAIEGNGNLLQWSWMKMPKDLFDAPSPFMPERWAFELKRKKLREALRMLFSGNTRSSDPKLLKLKVPLRSFDENGAQRKIETKGEVENFVFEQIVRRDLDRIFSESSPSHSPSHSPSVSIDDSSRLLSWAAQEKRGLPLFIDVQSYGGGAVELVDQGMILRPEMGVLNSQDYSLRSEMSFRGEKLIQEKNRELRQYVGLPVEAPTEKKDTLEPRAQSTQSRSASIVFAGESPRKEFSMDLRGMK